MTDLRYPKARVALHWRKYKGSALRDRRRDAPLIACGTFLIFFWVDVCSEGDLAGGRMPGRESGETRGWRRRRLLGRPTHGHGGDRQPNTQTMGVVAVFSFDTAASAHLF
ncbi:uncharacterized protein PV09_05362 [Verruconis gallopava]|uniref:Uncharacterized protein n=1 Tax=Verruconis gallopava TaxID=253628 RepID=A0A0D2AWS4_9PEZI|nr:uncharacterized protein PV09_05362 [Verruconis gallopava]KIW03609.1 hypothetical protein PV09_05362 [Verruconis gallopava]